MRVKFGVLQQTQGLHPHAKIRLNVFIVLACGGQNHNFGQILTFGGPRTDPLLPTRVNLGVLEQTQGLQVHGKCRLLL